MIETDGIFTEFHNYSLGEPLRIELIASESSATKARALSALRQKVLCVTIYSGADTKEFCRLTATLPHKDNGELLQRCIAPYAGKAVKVMLEVAPQDHKTLLYLIEEFYDQPRKMRLEISPESDLPTKQKAAPKAKGEFGHYWKRMYESTMLDALDLRLWLDCDMDSRVPEVWEKLHGAFGVKSLSFVSPEEAARKFTEANLPGIAAIARRLGESEET